MSFVVIVVLLLNTATKLLGAIEIFAGILTEPEGADRSSTTGHSSASVKLK